MPEILLKDRLTYVQAEECREALQEHFTGAPEGFFRSTKQSPKANSWAVVVPEEANIDQVGAARTFTHAFFKGWEARSGY